jgi:ubiquinone/menaquinone biosynthesis C-methylase UbiE
MSNESHHVCPWWAGYLLINPLRKLSEDPEKIFAPYIKRGMTVIDYGCAMGYFSIPLAKMTGTSGKVQCFDIQERMLKKLEQRARKRNLQKIILPHLITGNDEADFEGMEQSADFALLYHVIHEVPEKKTLFKNIYRMMKPGALLYFAEPPGHVKAVEFDQSVEYARQAGFVVEKSQADLKKNSVLFKKTN